MVKIIVVDRAGELEEISYEDTISNIHKITGYKTKRNFFDRGSWPWKGKYITLFAKDTGRANQENKYDMPPPVDKELYFGSCVLINYKDAEGVEVSDLTTSQWEKCYEHLFGGFESLGSEDSEEEEDEYDDLEKTAEGYAKDDFIVDDEEEVVYETKRNKKLNRSSRSHISTSSEEEFEYSSELEEEEYI